MWLCRNTTACIHTDFFPATYNHIHTAAHRDTCSQPYTYCLRWRVFGTTSAGGRISFTVQENALTAFKISFSFATDQGSCDVTSDTQISPSLGITGDEFSIEIPSITLTGTFDSNSTAAGHVKASEDSPRCVGGIDVDWTAFRQ